MEFDLLTMDAVRSGPGPAGQGLASGSDLGAARLLLVEDDEAYSYVMGKHLRAAGFEVTSFDNALAAMDHLEAHAVAALITDLDLPPGTPNGVSLALMAHRRWPDLPIVVLTGHEQASAHVDFPWAILLRKGEDAAAVIEALEAHLPGAA